MKKPLAIVTGASSGIGFELAILCAQEGFDLLVASDEEEIHEAASRFRRLDADVTAVDVDLSTKDGVAELWHAVGSRPVDVLLANAGRGLGGAFLDQDFEEVRHVIDTNVTGTVRLVQLVGRRMRDRGSGRILLTGSMAAFVPGTHQAVYNGTKAFIDSFGHALRAEMKDTGVTVTCLVPGPTEVAQDDEDDPAAVARAGFDAMMRGDADVGSGWKNGRQLAAGKITPPGMKAEQHRRIAEPGSASKARE